MKIYFKIGKKLENITDIKQLLRIGYSKNGGSFKRTYKDPECTMQECHPARRSFGDLLSICRTYFPRTPEKEVAKVLFELNREIGLGGSYCNTIHKPVFFVRGREYPLNLYFQGTEANRKGKSKYSFKMIEDLSKKK